MHVFIIRECDKHVNLLVLLCRLIYPLMHGYGAYYSTLFIWISCIKTILIHWYITMYGCPTRWPSGRRRSSADPRQMNSRVESRWRYECSSLVLVVCCVLSGLRNELITRLEESYRVCVCVFVCVCDLGILTMRRPRSELDSCVAKIMII